MAKFASPTWAVMSAISVTAPLGVPDAPSET